MSTEILVNIGPQETRVALVQSGAAQEVHVQRASRHGLTGNIYKGAVQRVLPGMQAAFVEIGLERTAFLHVADMVVACPERTTPTPTITQLLHEGKQVLVQVVKDPMGSKGARLTTLLSIPSRYLVLLPYENHVGVSARIEDEAERARLKQILDEAQQRLAPAFGVIARTAAESADATALEADLRFLLKLWRAVSESTASARPGTLVHGDLPLSMRIQRDLPGAVPLASDPQSTTPRNSAACCSLRRCSCPAPQPRSSCMKVRHRSSICMASKTISRGHWSAASS
jgi:ribonuclease G